MDDALPSGSFSFGWPVSGKIENSKNYLEDTEFIIGIGDNQVRRKIAERYDLNYITLVHPSAVIGKNVMLGAGTVVMAGAVINRGCIVGKHCIVNTGATVDHECVIGDYTHVSPGVHLGGQVEIGENSWIGIGGCVKNGVSICKDTIVGAGGVVIKNIKSSGIYIGNPVGKIRSEKFDFSES